MHVAPYLSLFGFTAIFHALRVIRLRMKYKISTGDGGNPELARMIRVFGNFSEFVPLGLILLVACELVQAPVWFLHLQAGCLVVGRTLHAMGLGRIAGRSHPRFFGMVLTFTSLALGSLGVLVFSSSTTN